MLTKAQINVLKIQNMLVSEPFVTFVNSDEIQKSIDELKKGLDCKVNTEIGQITLRPNANKTHCFVIEV